jgi:hypothetical protein
MLTCITLNTSDMKTLPRTQRAEELIDYARRAIAEERSELSGDSQIQISDLEREEGRAAFVLRCSGRPVLMCYACWSEILNESSWKAAEELFFKTTELDVHLDFGWTDRDLPAVPWIATVVLPDFAELQDAEASAVGALEPCVVWALIDIDANAKSGA